jgi:hypothetical protein
MTLLCRGRKGVHSSLEVAVLLSRQQRETTPLFCHVQWKEVITQFRAGMPCKRRRVKMHYDRCFSGPEAVQWLQEHLNTTRIFGDDIPRQKVLDGGCL